MQANRSDDPLDIDFEGIALPAVLLGTDLTVRRFSPQAEKTLNLVSSDINKPITEIKLSIQAPDLDKLVLAVITTGQVFEREIQDKAGRWYSMRIRPFKKENVISGTVIVLVDIDDIKRISDDFKEERDYSTAIIDTLREPFLILKNDLTIESANRSFYHTFEASPGGTLGNAIDQWCDSIELKSALNALLLERKSIRNFEIHHDFPRIGWKTLCMNVRTVRPDKQTDFIFIGIEDITERREIELEHEKTVAALEQFASAASHDLKAPLRKIIAFGERLRHELQGAGKENLDKMLASAIRMSVLMEELLQLSRLSARLELLEPVDLNAVVKEVLTDLETLIEESKAVISVESLPTVNANSLQMYQLFQNVIANALKYRKADIPPHIQITKQKLPDGFSQIIIKDNGIGFDQKQACEIFKPFVRLHGQSEYTGTGLGLAVCKKIVGRYGGDIQAKSSPGQGATFTIVFPFVTDLLESDLSELPIAPEPR